MYSITWTRRHMPTTANSPFTIHPTSPAVSLKPFEPLDTTVSLITPERIVFFYPLAGPFRRLFAYILDLFVLALIVFILAMISFALTLGSPSSAGIILVGYFFLSWGYGILCEAFLNGQTLGKKALHIRVVTDQGVPITGAQATLRNVVGTVDGLIPFAFMPGLASLCLTQRFQRLGDLAAGTMVIVEEPSVRAGVTKVNEPAVEALLPWLPLRIAAGKDLSRALSDYVKARLNFSAALRNEMAAPLARPFRRRFGLPNDSTSDAVLCAVYHRVFLGE